MSFQNWLMFQENSLQNLYTSTIQAFPGVQKRQHAVHTIEIKEIISTPFLGMNTLFIKGLAQSDSGKEYNPIILFKNVNYHNNKIPNLAEITAKDGRNYFFEKLSLENTDVLVRCNCKDFHWRFSYTDHQNESLYGKVRKKYEAKINPGSSNPLELPGMCKHLMALTKSLVNILGE